MEPDHREDQHETEPQATERSMKSTERHEFTAPFASEGLERVRDSHC
jgi:hypothetical protein